MIEPTLPGTEQPDPPYRLLITATPTINGDWVLGIDAQDLWTDTTRKVTARFAANERTLLRRIREELDDCMARAKGYLESDALRRAREPR